MSILTTSVGVLTTTFVPKVTSCSSYYIQDNSAGAYFLKFGTVGDASTSSCYPPNFAPLGYYSPGVCPTGYWHACEAGIDKTATVATCCPQDYTCKKGRATDDPHQCESKFEQVSWISVSQCYTKNGTPELPCGRFVTTTYTSGDRIFAYGINLRRAGTDPLWSGASGAIRRRPCPRLRAQPPAAASMSRYPRGVSDREAQPAKTGAKKEEVQRQAHMQYPASFAHASPQGADWARAQGPAAELSPFGYDGGTTYGGGGGESTAPYYNKQQFGTATNNNSPWPYELDPSPRNLVELGTSEPASTELAGREHTRNGVDTSPGPPRQL
ncbi:uncharacterized protein PG998_010134 [Apiospora kogelbergensis]|uniref:uncharacterized protein n=1 Tax=Apiospora kogelbergensis TaxID=1337665 RepID=UPI0031324902